MTEFGWLYIRPDRNRPWQVGDRFTAYPLGPPQPADESPVAKFTIPSHEHDWLDVTTIDGIDRSFICAGCGETKHEPR